MTDLGPVLAQILDSWGLPALFVLAVLETSFVTGLVVPSGAAAAFAAAVSRDDPATLLGVAVAAAAGGWLGDVVGFAVGRASGPRLLDGRGWSGRIFRRHRTTAGRLLGRHPLYSVTFARLVSFVRTLMPMSAGASGMTAATFLAYQLPGVLLWTALYLGIGVAAGESWQAATSLVGAGWLIVFLLIGTGLWIRARQQARARPR
ncbi:MAG: DedA family protein [Longimicrobiales bacterium]|nr:DedA family protein [Longimicrobiales bacterium]